MFELKSNMQSKVGTEREFGVVFALVFLLVGLYPLINGEDIRLWAVLIATIFVTLAYLAPKLLYIPNKLWFKLGIMLGSIIAPIVMMIVYFITVVPIGMIMRLMGKDLLRLKLDNNAKSYWIQRKHPIGSMRDQF
jgi:hypothetical protein